MYARGADFGGCPLFSSPLGSPKMSLGGREIVQSRGQCGAGNGGVLPQKRQKLPKSVLLLVHAGVPPSFINFIININLYNIINVSNRDG